MKDICYESEMNTRDSANAIPHTKITRLPAPIRGSTEFSAIRSAMNTPPSGIPAFLITVNPPPRYALK
ncbi:hypothetical protein T4D_8822 [Trichinella pseudospiralis]|uniref:Uncharacterized protein n=1 Tax=Trichinella pseudospiralis TaxID=6337 RepID=A0A0V1F9Q7_TRIPS|nr:hypothetical protein T4D_8822 [Trichinella pseudospiralis]